MAENIGNYPERVMEGVRSLPDVLRRPRALWKWVLDNPRLPLTILAILVAVPLLLVPVDLFLGKIYHPVAEEKLFGLMTSIKDDARLDRRKAQVRWLLWVLAAGASASLLLMRMPEIREDILAEEGETGTADDTVLAKPVMSASIGPKGRYRLQEEIGRGAMGIIYSAMDTVLDRPVAVKELPHHFTSDPDRYQRFQREARTLAKLAHPGIVQVFDLIEDEGRHFFIMELVQGGDLAEHVKREGQPSVPEACRLGISVSSALSYLHAEGVVHRDLKPANILLTRDRQPKLTDFGMARFVSDSGLTTEGAILGSPRYMSPEQAGGKEADHRSDLYSFGVLLYWLLTGRTPFDGDVASVLSQHLTQPPDPPSTLNSEIPGDVERVILSLLAKDPGEREQDLTDVTVTLRAWSETV